MITATRLMLLIDAENVSQAHQIGQAISQARALGTIVAAVAILPESHGKEMRRVLEEAAVTILPRLAEMPANAADALLACAALQESIQHLYHATDFIFISNDLGFGGPAALLRSHGYRCTRICNHPVAGSEAGFDQMIALAELPPPTEHLDFPAELFPDGEVTINLAHLGSRLARSSPELKRHLLRFGKTMAKSLAACALAYDWPIRVQTLGHTTQIVRC